MKVGIITKHCIENYGSFMQAYGLQAAIEKLGHDVEIIDYVYPNKYHPTHRNLKAKVLHSINYFLKNLLPGMPGKRFNKRYKDCWEEYYKLSKHYPDRDSIFSSPPIYDIYVAGSDQIWRPKFTNGDSVFFCDFAPKGYKRVSYASSFGCLNIPSEFKESYKSLLLKFSKIGVREKSAVNVVSDLANINSKQVIDPSLLLTSNEWRKISLSPNKNKDYIVCYGRIEMEFTHRIAREFANLYNCDVVRINGKFYDYFSRDMKYVLDAGPKEWLGLIDKAKIVIIGGSFHGTAFAIQFHKPFLSILSGNEDHDTRQKNLLNNLGLDDLAIYNSNYDVDVLGKKIMNIDWNGVDSKLNNLRLESYDFLRSCFDN